MSSCLFQSRESKDSLDTGQVGLESVLVAPILNSLETQNKALGMPKASDCLDATKADSQQIDEEHRQETSHRRKPRTVCRAKKVSEHEDSQGTSQEASKKTQL